MPQKGSLSAFVTNSLTIFSVFLMGLIDAYTFIEQNKTFASAQTGNLVSLSIKVFTGKFDEVSSHITVFAGFALGAFIGQTLIDLFKWQGLHKTQIILLFQLVLLAFLAFFQGFLADSIMLFLLGLLAGYELTVFRQFRGTNVNNGIMTGNTKNMMTNLYNALFDHDKKARNTFINILTIIIVFMLGAGVGALVIKLNSELNLWVAFLLVLLSFLATLFSRSEKRKDMAS